MFKKIVILSIMFLPLAGAAIHDASALALLVVGCIPALAVSLVVIQSDTAQEP